MPVSCAPAGRAHSAQRTTQAKSPHNRPRDKTPAPAPGHDRAGTHTRAGHGTGRGGKTAAARGIEGENRELLNLLWPAEGFRLPPLAAGTVHRRPFRDSPPAGGGGMGNVYLAEHATLPDIKCAIKVLHPELSANDGFVACCARRRAASHGSIMTTWCRSVIFTWQECYCVVQSFVSGETLSKVISKTREACRYLGAAADW